MLRVESTVEAKTAEDASIAMLHENDHLTELGGRPGSMQKCSGECLRTLLAGPSASHLTCRGRWRGNRVLFVRHAHNTLGITNLKAFLAESIMRGQKLQSVALLPWKTTLDSSMLSNSSKGFLLGSWGGRPGLVQRY